MEWHINELSLAEQFQDPETFRYALEPLLQLRASDPLLQNRLYCSRTLHRCKVTPKYNLQNAVFATGDKTYIHLVLSWANKSGPFWNDERQFEKDDYFEYQGLDVTDQGLGEAARRRIAGLEANSYSFQDSGYEKSPLPVQHGLPEEPIGIIEIINHWQIEQLRAALDTCRALNGWKDTLEEINRRFNNFVIAENVMDKLMPCPFSAHVAQEIIIRLDVLSEIVDESDKTGGLSKDGIALHEKHFVGDKAWFTDESKDNKIQFRKDMTFPDPRDITKNIFCPFHGKIKTPQIRIHFEWPRPRGQREIKIVYIGPKITKK
jgi:hypothetical protein